MSPSDTPSPDAGAEPRADEAPPSPRGTSGSERWKPLPPEALRSAIPGYEIHSLIGHGGMGAVYEGTQESLSRKVAIKILPPGIESDDPGYVARFRNEARLMASVSHPAIVTVFDFGRTDEGLLYFVMEHVDGMDVLQLMRASPGRRLSPAHARDIASHVCDALTFAHGRGVIHRDIKPANVLIDHDGRVKVADFGLAKWCAPGMEPRLTRTGAAVGTPGYIAPEALIEGVEVDERADVYAVGAMLFQMLTGRPPQGWLQSPSGEVPGLGADFDAILQRALEPNPDDRYPSAGELHADLAAIPMESLGSSVDENAETVFVPRTTTETVSAAPAGRGGTLWKWMAVLLLAVWVTVWWLNGPRPADTAPSTEDVPAAVKTGDIPAALTPPNRRVEGAGEIDASPLAPPVRRVEE